MIGSRKSNHRTTTSTTGRTQLHPFDKAPACPSSTTPSLSSTEIVLPRNKCEKSTLKSSMKKSLASINCSAHPNTAGVRPVAVANTTSATHEQSDTAAPLPSAIPIHDEGKLRRHLKRTARPRARRSSSLSHKKSEATSSTCRPRRKTISFHASLRDDRASGAKYKRPSRPLLVPAVKKGVDAPSNFGGRSRQRSRDAPSAAIVRDAPGSIMSRNSRSRSRPRPMRASSKLPGDSAGNSAFTVVRPGARGSSCPPGKYGSCPTPKSNSNSKSDRPDEPRSHNFSVVVRSRYSRDVTTASVSSSIISLGRRGSAIIRKNPSNDKQLRRSVQNSLSTSRLEPGVDDDYRLNTVVKSHSSNAMKLQAKLGFHSSHTEKSKSPRDVRSGAGEDESTIAFTVANSHRRAVVTKGLQKKLNANNSGRTRFKRGDSDETTPTSSTLSLSDDEGDADLSRHRSESSSGPVQPMKALSLENQPQKNPSESEQREASQSQVKQSQAQSHTCVDSINKAPSSSKVIQYELGEKASDPAKQLHKFESNSEAVSKVSTLPINSGVFVKRTNREWTYAILVERHAVPTSDQHTQQSCQDPLQQSPLSDMENEDHIVVVLDKDHSSKKIIGKSKWRSCVRLPKSENSAVTADGEEAKSPPSSSSSSSPLQVKQVRRNSDPPKVSFTMADWKKIKAARASALSKHGKKDRENFSKSLTFLDETQDITPTFCRKVSKSSIGTGSTTSKKSSSTLVTSNKGKSNKTKSDIPVKIQAPSTEDQSAPAIPSPSTPPTSNCRRSLKKSASLGYFPRHSIRRQETSESMNNDSTAAVMATTNRPAVHNSIPFPAPATSPATTKLSLDKHFEGMSPKPNLQAKSFYGSRRERMRPVPRTNDTHSQSSPSLLSGLDQLELATEDDLTQCGDIGVGGIARQRCVSVGQPRKFKLKGLDP